MSVPYLKEKEETIKSFMRFAEGEGMPEWPLEIFLEISNICNLRCAMCNTFSALSSARKAVIQNTQRGFMDVADITSSLEPLFAHALQVHAFGFGEPTIHPHFREIIDHLSKFGVMVDFFTNGTHLDQDMCEFLVDRKVTKLTMSMSGSTKEEYENVYLGSSFEKVTEGLQRLNRLKKERNTKFPIVEVNSIAFVHHVEKFLDFVELMGERGVKVIHLKPLSTYDTIQELHGHISIPRQDVEIPMLERAKEIAKKYNMIIGSKPYENLAAASKAGALKHRGRAAMSTEFVPLSELAERARKRQTEHQPEPAGEKKKSVYLDAESMERVAAEGIPCLEPFKTFYVAYSGDVYPCCFKSSTTALGSIRNEPGISVWRNRNYTTVREEIAGLNQYPSAVCGGCLKAQTYPQGHATGHRVATYHEWCAEVFGGGLSGDLIARTKALRPNKDILAAHRSGRK